MIGAFALALLAAHPAVASDCSASPGYDEAKRYIDCTIETAEELETKDASALSEAACKAYCENKKKVDAQTAAPAPAPAPEPLSNGNDDESTPSEVLLQGL